jgi:xanthine phosphoribosyltransferase
MAGGPERPGLKISKAKLDQDIALLVDRLPPNKRWRAVVGVANGGVYPAGKVADRLNLEYREIRVSSYIGQVKAPPKVLRAIDDADKGAGLLVVDDVIDSGDTALVIRQMLPAADFATVYVKPVGLRKFQDHGTSLTFAEQYPQDFWIVFPWDQAGWDPEPPSSVAEYRQGM